MVGVIGPFFIVEKLQIGLKYCLHSTHSGGVSAPAIAGIPDRRFKRHGR